MRLQIYSAPFNHKVCGQSHEKDSAKNLSAIWKAAEFTRFIQSTLIITTLSVNSDSATAQTITYAEVLPTLQTYCLNQIKL